MKICIGYDPREAAVYHTLVDSILLIAVAASALLAGVAVFGSGVYTSAFPALPHRVWKQVASQTRRLRDLADRVRMLENSLEKARNDDAAKGRLP